MCCFSFSFALVPLRHGVAPVLNAAEAICDALRFLRSRGGATTRQVAKEDRQHTCRATSRVAKVGRPQCETDSTKRAALENLGWGKQTGVGIERAWAGAWSNIST